MFAVDLDGTLLARDGTIDPVDLDALARVRASGVAVSVITGRLYSGTRPSALAIGAGGPVACLDGSHIVRASDNAELLHVPIDPGVAGRVRGAIADHRLAHFLFANDEIVHDDEGRPYVDYVRGWSPNLRSHGRALEHPHWEGPRGIGALVSIGERDELRAAVERVRREAGESASVVSFPVRSAGAVWAMMVRADGHTKGTALRFLAAHHGIGPEDVAVVGDWLNDLPMFAVAGRSFAMGHAPDEVKQAATDVLEARAAGGVAEAARRAGLL